MTFIQLSLGCNFRKQLARVPPTSPPQLAETINSTSLPLVSVPTPHLSPPHLPAPKSSSLPNFSILPRMSQIANSVGLYFQKAFYARLNTKTLPFLISNKNNPARLTQSLNVQIHAVHTDMHGLLHVHASHRYSK